MYVVATELLPPEVCLFNQLSAPFCLSDPRKLTVNSQDDSSQKTIRHHPEQQDLYVARQLRGTPLWIIIRTQISHSS